VCGQQCPATVETTFDDSGQHRLTAWAVHPVGELIHETPFGESAVKVRSEHRAAGEIVLPVNRPRVVAVHVSAVAGECNQIGRRWWAREVEPLPVVAARVGLRNIRAHAKGSGAGSKNSLPRDSAATLSRDHRERFNAGAPRSLTLSRDHRERFNAGASEGAARPGRRASPPSIGSSRTYEVTERKRETSRDALVRLGLAAYHLLFITVFTTSPTALTIPSAACWPSLG
jgi:hypothetical protein